MAKMALDPEVEARQAAMEAEGVDIVEMADLQRDEDRARAQRTVIDVGASSVAALAPVERVENALVQPAAPLAVIQESFAAYQALTRSLLTDDDYQVLQGKRFPKKSAWRKLSVAFGVSFEIVKRILVREIADDPTSPVVYAEFIVRATAPNGRFADGWGCCDASEKRFEKKGVEKQHDLISTAETRAKNRAASDLFGMGEVSAEEVDGGSGGGRSGGGGRGTRQRPATKPDASRPSGGGQDAAPPPQGRTPDHVHEWKPAPREGFVLCAVEGCGKGSAISHLSEQEQAALKS